MEKLNSRKLLMALFAIALTVVNKWADLGLDQYTITQMIFATASYIIGQGLVDAATAIKK